MAVVEIEEVRPIPSNPALLRGYHIDAPQSGTKAGGYTLDLAGWVLGRSSPVSSFRVLHQDIVVRHASVAEKRPDLVRVFPGVDRAGACGFRTALSTLGLSSGFDLLLQTVLQDDTVVSLARVRGRWQPPRSAFRPRLQPLLLTSLGRSGSTWLTVLLGRHPQIVTYRPFQAEPRVVSYWLEVLKDLSEPASYRQALSPTEISSPHWWLGDRKAGAVPPVANCKLDPAMRSWIERGAIEELVALCQSRIETFYQHAARAQGQEQPRFFAEKFLPNRIPGRVCDLYENAREVILVRDFRDMVCSILAFNRKLGYPSFGRHRARNDEEYIHQLRNSAMDLLRAWKQRSDRAYLLRYEDLIRQPEKMLREMLGYLDLDADDTIVERTLERANNLTPELQKGHRTSEDAEASVGRWQRDMPRSLHGACREAFGEALEQFGYEV
jgi:hypothetical protein